MFHILEFSFKLIFELAKRDSPNLTSGKLGPIFEMITSEKWSYSSKSEERFCKCRKNKKVDITTDSLETIQDSKIMSSHDNFKWMYINNNRIHSQADKYLGNSQQISAKATELTWTHNSRIMDLPLIMTPGTERWAGEAQINFKSC